VGYFAVAAGRGLPRIVVLPRDSPFDFDVLPLSLQFAAKPTTSGRSAAAIAAPVARHSELLQKLREVFDVPIAVLQLGPGELHHVTGAWLHIDVDRWLPLLEELARRGRPEIVEDCAPLAVLAVPLPAGGDDEVCSQVALATFVTQQVAHIDEVRAAAAAVGVDADACWRWYQHQPVWPTRAIEHLSQSMVEHTTTAAENQKLRRQLTNVSQHLLQTFDELNLLHRINERMSIETDEHQLLDTVVDWMSRVLPAECLLACIEPQPASDDASPAPPSEWVYAGNCPVAADELDLFFERLGPDVRTSMVIIDREVTGSAAWFYPTVREVISVPIRSGSNVSGWLLAINYRADAGQAARDFGTLETSLLLSISSLLGMHSGNVRLYNNQASFFESVVRALSSAIDAKDPYTRGHSERVARIAVLIGRQLGCTPEQLNHIYLSGLLHDIGKIGIDDNILRKPGALTPEEFEHIKLHPELGYRILQGVRQLEHVLPVVLHHHEAWDGSGYPGKLARTDIPWLARIVAVADAFDAMSSDRPYRSGMPAETLDAIFRGESGKQWDPQVVNAFFAVREAIDAIIEKDRQQLSLDVGQWSEREVGSVLCG
jgi:HD-GYP domain-containing protein (c-di-GMP phosphodiesterase class II)